MSRSSLILSLCLSLAIAPFLHAEMLTPSAEVAVSGTAGSGAALTPSVAVAAGFSPTAEATVQPTPVPTAELGEVPKPNAHAEPTGGFRWSQLIWGVLTIAVIATLIVVISNQPHSGNGSGGQYSY